MVCLNLFLIGRGFLRLYMDFIRVCHCLLYYFLLFIFDKDGTVTARRGELLAIPRKITP